MAEHAFLDAVVDFLDSPALSPAPSTIGIAEPAGAGDMPAVVLWLEDVRPGGQGLGQRSALITDGALPWSVTIDLENPVLPADPSFVLLSPDRMQLVLHHGGLVRSDGSAGPLGAGDIEVRVAGALYQVVPAAPENQEVAVDPLVGTLSFGTALPATGEVEASYFLGQWEQRVQRIAGTLVVAIMAVDAGDVSALSRSIAQILQPPAPGTVVAGLLHIRASGMSSIGRPDQTSNDARTRTRTIRFAFDFEYVVNEPASSGGIIQRVPITTGLVVNPADPDDTGVVLDEETATE